MQNFASTPGERCRQEVNVILNDLDAHLKMIRAQIVENYHFVVPKPRFYFTNRIYSAINKAADQVAEAEHYWKRGV